MASDLRSGALGVVSSAMRDYTRLSRCLLVYLYLVNLFTMAGNGYVILYLFEDFGLSIFFAQKHPRRKKGDLHFASKCIIFALQERRCYPDR